MENKKVTIIGKTSKIFEKQAQGNCIKYLLRIGNSAKKANCYGFTGLVSYLHEWYKNKTIDDNTLLSCDGITEGEEEAVNYCLNLIRGFEKAKENIKHAIKMDSLYLNDKVDGYLKNIL